MVVMKVETDIIVSITASLVKQNFKTFNTDMIVFISWHHYVIPVNPPPFRGSLPRKSLISRMDWVSCAGDINLPHTPFPPARPPPT